MPISTVLFDLDNTIYPASSGLMKDIDRRINAYVKDLLGLDEPASVALRQEYYAEYGTTLHGLQRNHGIDPDHYLEYVHDLAIESFLAVNAELDQLLGDLRAQKAVFTNSPATYARRVLSVLGIEQHFSHVFDIRFANFKPKPDPAAYQLVLDTLGADPRNSILVEDTPKNLPPAHALGMTTILVGEPRPEFGSTIDYTVPDVLEAVRIAIPLAA